MVIGILVKNIMTKPAVKIKHNVSVQKAAKEMVKQRVGSIIVVKNRNPIGIITETDLNKKIVAPGKDPRKVKVEEIMSTPIVFSHPNDDVESAVEKMERHRIKRLPVVDRGKIVGIITNTDIARASPEMIDILNFRLKMRREVPSIREGLTSGICEVCGEYSPDLKFVDDQWVCVNCREREM
ncbi:MAG: cyclic nucleotide-binding/CBS domain-containing protein [Methanosarcinales archaeon]